MTLAWILGHHWREVGEPAKAIPYLLAAADAAQNGWAKDAAVDFYTKAFELAEDDELRREIRMKRALALVALAGLRARSRRARRAAPRAPGKSG